RSSAQVWSRHGGYPGAAAYLEFHKIRWPGGLKLWRVSEPGTDLGDKAPYEPDAARSQANAHAGHFARLLDRVSVAQLEKGGNVIVAPFDTELFGHWWFEGPEFLGEVFQSLREHPRLRATTAAAHLERTPPRVGTKLARGSWGRDGDFSMWLNDRVQDMWPTIWELEGAFWDVAPRALATPAAHALLAQAARSLLLLQSSDWPFIVTTGAVADYALDRFAGHARDTRTLLIGVHEVLAGGEARAIRAEAEALGRRDHLFPGILASVADAVGDDLIAVAADRAEHAPPNS
ncbi:MAG TPA: 1,4-alpha-glucan branching protein domain-containing protein, partial [Gemmatimonadaceae bacterium]|nr:1,4-alpha-glucan branching protein domain-containing protein [Gemmatimonadaceae bacterium]